VAGFTPGSDDRSALRMNLPLGSAAWLTGAGTQGKSQRL
jgi:hypothetical protein